MHTVVVVHPRKLLLATHQIFMHIEHPHFIKVIIYQLKRMNQSMSSQEERFILMPRHLSSANKISKKPSSEYKLYDTLYMILFRSIG